MLHLANGESTAGLLSAAGLPGDIESADDILMEGQTANGLVHWSEWERRADHLEQYLAIPRADYLLHTLQRQALLTRALSEDEAVLWFEEDVFCQINYAQALHWLSERDLSQANLTYVCPPDERLGNLSPARLVYWFERRQPVSAALLELAAQAWQALSSASPEDLQRFVHTADFSAWPKLRAGLRAQLARLPYVRSGINRIERSALKLIERGHTKFGALFPRLQDEVPEYGLGDTSVARYLLDLGREPALIHIAGAAGPAVLAAGAPDWTMRLTPLGAEVLRAQTDYAALGAIDRWLGGVHLLGRPAWRFDPDSESVVRG